MTQAEEQVLVGATRTIVVVTLSTVIAMMPAFLVGASAVFIRDDIGLDQVGLGMAVATFMASSAIFSFVGGRFSERVGAGSALIYVGIGNAAVMLAIAAFAQRQAHLFLLLAVGGICNGIAQPAGNMALAREVFVRPALMFGIKQSAIPLATLFAGATVPLVSLTVGWRWAFALGGVLGFLVSALVPKRLAPARPAGTDTSRLGDARLRPLLILAAASGFGSAASVAMASFLVETVVAGGMQAGNAGWLLVLGSVTGVVARLLSGWLADRQRGWALYIVSTMLFIGAFGYLLISLGSPLLAIIGTILAYGGGWGWTGLFFYAVVRLNPRAPASATGIVATGGSAGAALGPLLFGYVASLISFQAAWTVSAIAALISGVLMLIGRNRLLRDRERGVSSR